MLRSVRVRCAQLVFVAVATISAHSAAAPTISVRARTELRLESPSATAAGVRVRGRVLEPGSGQPIANAEVTVALDQQEAKAVSDGAGNFEVVFSAAAGAHSIRATVVGNRHVDASEFTTKHSEAALQSPQLTATADVRGASLDITVRAQSEGQPIDIEVALAIISGGTELLRTDAELTQGETNWRVALAELGGIGAKEISVVFAGNDYLQPAATRTALAVTLPARVDLALESMQLTHEESVTGSGRVLVNGDGLGTVRVRIMAGSKQIGEVVTDAGGQFVFASAASELGPGTFVVRAVYDSKRADVASARSPSFTVQIGEPKPVPISYSVAALIATATLALAFVVMRQRNWFRRAPPSSQSTPEPKPAPAAKGGLSLGRPSLVSTLRRASDHSFAGTCTDAVKHRPIAGATVTITCADGSTHSQRSDAAGRFRFDELPRGSWHGSATQDGYVSESFELSIPHRGELAEATLTLVEVREWVFEIYRGAALPLLPAPELWCIWSPRQVLDHVRRDSRAPALDQLTLFVEEAYFSARPSQETILPAAQRLADDARQNLHRT